MLKIKYTETLGWAAYGSIRLSDYYPTKAQATVYANDLIRRWKEREARWEDTVREAREIERRAQAYLKKLARKKGVHRVPSVAFFNRNLMNSMKMRENRKAEKI